MKAKTKAEIKQNIVFAPEDLEQLERVAERIGGNVYIVNQNTGSINVQNNLVDCLATKFKQRIGLKEVMDQLRELYINFALAECKTVTAAAKRLKVTERTLFNHRYKYKKAPVDEPRPDLVITKDAIFKKGFPD